MASFSRGKETALASRQGVAVACKFGTKAWGSGSYEESNRPLDGRCFGFVGGKKLWLLGLRLRGRVQLDSGVVAQSDAASHGVKLAVGVFAVTFFVEEM